MKSNLIKKVLFFVSHFIKRCNICHTFSKDQKINKYQKYNFFESVNIKKSHRKISNENEGEKNFGWKFQLKKKDVPEVIKSSKII